MKFLKRLIIGILGLVVVLFVVLAVFISTLDLNAYKEEIQQAIKDQTGRDLIINGELEASFFPWIGISIGELALSNAAGFGDKPFARMDGAQVKIEVIPLLRRQINVDSVRLDGLNLDLQRDAKGHTNWDDLTQASASTTTTTDKDQTTEVEGGAPAIAALAVGGISISNANISWLDVQGATDLKMSNFNFETGSIELGKPFSLDIGFDVKSNSLALESRVDTEGDITLDLENQKYSLSSFKIQASASGEGVPIKNAALMLGGDITADLGAQQLDIEKLVFESLGIALEGAVKITNLDADPQIVASLSSSDDFSLLALFEKLEIEAPVTADDSVMQAVSLQMQVKANAKQAELSDLTIKLDETTFKGHAEVLDLAGDLPPIRFSFNVDAIDVDRYLPPPPPEGAVATAEKPAEGAAPEVASAEDIPIELPLELIRKLDIEGEFSVDSFIISHLVTKNILIPLKAKAGVITLDGIAAELYEGNILSTVSLNAQKDTPVYSVKMALPGIQAEPLLKDLLQDDAPLSGKGSFDLDIKTTGNSVNALTSALNGRYGLVFADGAVNGVNIGYQLRRAQAKIKGQSFDGEAADYERTDFSALTMTGKFVNGVLNSDDLDLRAPGLRIEGAGIVDLPKTYVDYKLKTLLGGTSEGQGGRDKSDLTGLRISLPIRGTFDELSADFTSVIIQAMKDDLKNRINEAKDKAKAKLNAEKAKAKAKLKAEEEKAKAKLKAQLKDKEAKASAELKKKAAKAKAKLKASEKEKLDKLKEKAKNKLKGLFN